MVNGTCNQGYCNNMLELVEVRPDGLHGLAGMPLSSDSSGALEDCDKALEAPPGTASAASASASASAFAPLPSSDEDCVRIDGHWRVEPGPDPEWKDVVVTFEGAEFVKDAETHKLVRHGIAETQVLRHRGDKYDVVQGDNPTHGF